MICDINLESSLSRAHSPIIPKIPNVPKTMSTTNLSTPPSRDSRPGILRSLFLLVGALALLASDLRADTVIKDPAGVNLCFGLSTLKVNLNMAYDQATSTSETTCILLGMIKGRCAVADPAQQNTGSAVTNHWGKIYLVDLIGGTNAVEHARFSGLEQDIIKMPQQVIYGFFGWTPYKPSMFFSPNSFNYNNNVGTSYPFTGTPRCQILQWQNPLMTNQTNPQIAITFNNLDPILGNSGGVQFFSLVTSTNNGVPEQQLVYTNIAGLNKYAIITAIDAIDVNPWSTTSNTATNNPALIIWANSNTNASGAERFLPDTVYVLNQDTNTGYFSVTTNYAMPDTERKYAHGGFLTAPDGKGGLAYYFCQNQLEHSSGWNYARSTIFSMPISSQGNAITLNSPQVFSQNDQYFNSVGSTAGAFEHIIGSSLDVLYTYTGPELDFINNTNNGSGFENEVHVRPSLMRETGGEAHFNFLNSDLVGFLSSVDTNTLDNSLNQQNLNFVGGPIPSNNVQGLVNRSLLTRGVQVQQVFLGFPYFALPVDKWGNPTVDANGNDFNPSIEGSSNNIHVYNESYNNGVSVSLQLGFGVKNIPVWGDSSAGVKGSFEYEFAKQNSASTEITTTMKYKTTAWKDWSAGFVTYLELKPAVQKWCNLCWSSWLINNGALQTNFSVGGNPNFSWPLVSLSQDAATGSADAQTLWVQPFQLTNPTISTSGVDYPNTPDFSTSASPLVTNATYSALSDGLLPNPYTTLFTCTTNQATNLTSLTAVHNIRAWESSNNILATLDTFQSDHAGVKKIGEIRDSFNASHTLKIDYKESISDTHSYKYSAGLWWDVSSFVVSKGEINYVGGQSFNNTFGKGSSFSIYMPSATTRAACTREYYYYHIDISALKSWMATHTYTLAGTTHTNVAVRPNFIPIFCWNNDQNFDLGFPWLP